MIKGLFVNRLKFGAEIEVELEFIHETRSKAPTCVFGVDEEFIELIGSSLNQAPPINPHSVRPTDL